MTMAERYDHHSVEAKEQSLGMISGTFLSCLPFPFAIGILPLGCISLL